MTTLTTTSTHCRLLVARVGAGDQEAWSELVEITYDVLRTRARGLVPRGPFALEPTELVNDVLGEIGLKLDEIEFQGLTHFIALTSRKLRQRLIDLRRKEQAAKRGRGRIEFLPASTVAAVTQGADTADLIDLEEALDRLRAYDEQLWRITEAKLAGFSDKEIAAAESLGLSTVQLKWALARGLLKGFLRDGDEHAGARGAEAAGGAV